MTIELPDELVALERRAWREIQEGRLTIDTALAVHQGIGAYVKAAKQAGEEVDRYRVEMELKRIVRHGQPV